jgi:hypothetical protein
MYHESGIPVSGLALKTLHKLLCLGVHVTWPAHLTHVALIILIMFGEQWKLWSSALCNFLHSYHFLLFKPKCFPQYRVLKRFSLRGQVSPSLVHIRIWVQFVGRLLLTFNSLFPISSPRFSLFQPHFTRICVHRKRARSCLHLLCKKFSTWWWILTKLGTRNDPSSLILLTCSVHW